MSKYHIVCFSGGNSSAKIAIYLNQQAEKGLVDKSKIILLNHDININAELKDVKRFKNEISELVGIKITYANMENFKELDQFDVAIKHGGFKFSPVAYTCSKHMKTEPFKKWINDNQEIAKNAIFYYGFDDTKKEAIRAIRRKRIMIEMGDYETRFIFQDGIIVDNPVALPDQYAYMKHANCIGCFKGGSQHWYVVYCRFPDIWEKAKATEEKIGHSILSTMKDKIKSKKFLKEFECDFHKMKSLGVEPNENIPSHKFWADAKRLLKEPSLFNYTAWETDCDCMVG